MTGIILKHNRNANAIVSLGAEEQEVATDIRALIVATNKSIAETDRFIPSMAEN